MDTQIGYKRLQYTVWTVNYSNQIPSRYAQNRIWADGLNEARLSYSSVNATVGPISLWTYSLHDNYRLVNSCFCLFRVVCGHMRGFHYRLPLLQCPMLLVDWFSKAGWVLSYLHQALPFPLLSPQTFNHLYLQAVDIRPRTACILYHTLFP